MEYVQIVMITVAFIALGFAGGVGVGKYMATPAPTPDSKTVILRLLVADVDTDKAPISADGSEVSCKSVQVDLLVEPNGHVVLDLDFSRGSPAVFVQPK